jgi:hypothetical protein
MSKSAQAKNKSVPDSAHRPKRPHVFSTRGTKKAGIDRERRLARGGTELGSGVGIDTDSTLV